jgi:PAS domain S-box-containing protein
VADLGGTLQEEDNTKESLIEALAEAQRRINQLEIGLAEAAQEQQRLDETQAAHLAWLNEQLQQEKYGRLQAESALQQAYDQLGLHLDELAVLNMVAQTLVSITDLPVALVVVSETVTHLLAGHDTTVMLLIETESEMRLLAHYSSQLDDSVLSIAMLLPELKAQLVETKQAIIVPSDPTDPRLERLQALDLTCLMVIPLLARGEVIGAIQVTATQPGRTFRRTEVALVETIASQVVGTIETARLFAEEHRHRQVAESLQEISTALVSHLEPEIVFAEIMTQLGQVIENDNGAILLQEGENLVLTAGLGPAAQAHIGEQIPLSSLNPAAQAFNSRTTLIINYEEDQENYGMKWPGGEPILTWIGVPLSVGQQTIGLLTVDSFRPRIYNETEIQLLQTFANQAAIAIQNARLFEALRTSEERYRAVVEDQNELVVRFLPDGTITFVNEAYTRFFGLPPKALVGQTFLPLIFPEDRQRVIDYLERQRLKPIFDPIEHRVIAAAGEIRWVQWSNRSIRDDQGQIIEYQGVGRDVTQQKYLEEQLRQSQKMQALGQLAGGVAHHFNNMLTSIIGFVSFATEALPHQHQARQDLERVLSIARHAANLIHQLLTFTRTQPVQLKITDLNPLILKMEETIQQTIGQKVQLITHLAPDLDLTQVNPQQFEQLLGNLVINAREAMPEGGILTLETGNIKVVAPEASLPEIVPPGSYIRLRVIDTGVGMTEELQARIFEPFFTTKEVGQGPGLGLSTCFGIMKQHEGYITVDSAPGQGSTFSLYFPQVPVEMDLLPVTGGQIYPSACQYSRS